jgi:hypothetical protein
VLPSGNLNPVLNLFTKTLSPTKNVGSIEPDGMKKTPKNIVTKTKIEQKLNDDFTDLYILFVFKKGINKAKSK